MRHATVWMAQKCAGELYESADGDFVFQYNELYLNDREAQALSLTLPLVPGAFRSVILHPFFDGLIPEGWLREIAMAHFKIKPLDRFGLLLATGGDTVGACAVCPEGESPALSIETPNTLHLGEAELGLELDFGLEDIAWLGLDYIASKANVAGYQPKLSLGLSKNETGKIRNTLVGQPSGFILKPPVAEFPELPELEFITMQLAQWVGIRTAKFGLATLADGHRAYITQRFDRDGTRKIHQEDMAQAMGIPTEYKYNGSYERILKLIIQQSNNPTADVEQFARILVFSYLTGNSDMHLKNFSFQYPAKNQTRLSPAYDLVPVALVYPADTEDTALTLNGKKKRLTRNDFISLFERGNLPVSLLDAMLHQFVLKSEEWKSIILNPMLSPEKQTEYVELIEYRLAKLSA